MELGWQVNTHISAQGHTARHTRRWCGWFYTVCDPVQTDIRTQVLGKLQFGLRAFKTTASNLAVQQSETCRTGRLSLQHATCPNNRNPQSAVSTASKRVPHWRWFIALFNGVGSGSDTNHLIGRWSHKKATILQPVTVPTMILYPFGAVSPSFFFLPKTSHRCILIRKSIYFTPQGE